VARRREPLDRAEPPAQRDRVRPQRRLGIDRRAAPQVERNGHERFFTSARNSALSSAWGAPAGNGAKAPRSPVAFADFMKAPQTTRESALPTLMRRVPSAASSDTVMPSGADMMTLTGFGATAPITAPISSRVRRPGA